MADRTISGSHGTFAGESAPLRSAKASRTGRRYAAEDSRSVLKCLKIASLAAAILLVPGAKIDAQQPLSADQIENQIVGRSFQGRKGIVSVSLRYAKDGTVTMRSLLGAGSGKWVLSENRLCVELETGPRRAKECLTFVRQSDGSYRASNGMRLIPAQ